MAYNQPSSGPFKMMGSSSFKKDKLPLDASESPKTMPTPDSKAKELGAGVGQLSKDELTKIRAANHEKDKAITNKKKKAYQAALENYYTMMEESDGKYKGKRPKLER